MTRPLRELLEEPLYTSEDAARVAPRVRETLAARRRARRHAQDRQLRNWRAAAVAAAILAVTGTVGTWRLTRSTGPAIAETPPSAAVFGPLRDTETGTTLAVVQAGGDPMEVALDDGSSLTLEPGTRLEAMVNDGERVVLALGEGAITLDIRPNGPRAWTVDAGGFLVDVLGTRFRVERGAQRGEIRVERGLVRVRGDRVPGGVRRLSAGDSLLIAPTVAVPVDPAEAARTSTPEPGEGPAAWRALANAGDYEAAYRTLGPRRLARELRRARDVDELLALADTARLTGHARDAVAPLREVTRHRRDGRAGVAAFTLGRIYAESLSQPRPAATAFEQAIDLGLPAALRGAAFVRLTEAHLRADDRAAAEAALRRYRAESPSGSETARLEALLAD